MSLQEDVSSRTSLESVLGKAFSPPMGNFGGAGEKMWGFICSHQVSPARFGLWGYTWPKNGFDNAGVSLMCT